MRSLAASLRIGCVKYLNARPLIHGWPGPVSFDHPAALSEKLAAGELDVAFVSSFEFLRNPVYTIADDVALGSDGAVYSVFVAHEDSIENIREIAVDPASLTSVNLLRCILAERGLQPAFVALAGDDAAEVNLERGCLLIGDQAIRFRESHTGSFEFLDLGAEWRRMTGLPFVFALWLLRPEAEQPRDIADLLRRQRDNNLHSLERLIAAEKDFAPEFCARYFRSYLRFGFAEAEKAGLLKFRALCEKHGILPPNATPLRLV